jgi:hypothetical protein
MCRSPAALVASVVVFKLFLVVFGLLQNNCMHYVRCGGVPLSARLHIYPAEEMAQDMGRNAIKERCQRDVGHTRLCHGLRFIQIKSMCHLFKTWQYDSTFQVAALSGAATCRARARRPVRERAQHDIPRGFFEIPSREPTGASSAVREQVVLNFFMTIMCPAARADSEEKNAPDGRVIDESETRPAKRFKSSEEQSAADERQAAMHNHAAHACCAQPGLSPWARPKLCQCSPLSARLSRQPLYPPGLRRRCAPPSGRPAAS